jgi:hypothetical protein
MLDTVIKVLGRYPGKQPCSALASYKRKAEKLLIRAQTFHHTVAQSFNLDSVLGLAQLRCNALSKHGYFNIDTTSKVYLKTVRYALSLHSSSILTL